MKKRVLFLGLVAALLVAAVPAWSAEDEGPDPDREANLAAMEASRTEALAVLKRMSDFLTKQESFRIQAHSGYDVVQSVGIKLEFGGDRTITVHRPDRLLIEIRERTGESSTVRFDGRAISVFFPAENAYVSIEKPGSLEQAIAYLAEDFGVPMPMSDFLEPDFYAAVVDQVELGVVVDDESRIAGHLCTHLAFQTNTLVFQLWVQNGDVPLPRRIVITHQEEDQSPQFWAQIQDWELGVETSDELFEFTPPKGAERLIARPTTVSTASAGGQ